MASSSGRHFSSTVPSGRSRIPYSTYASSAAGVSAFSGGFDPYDAIASSRDDHWSRRRRAPSDSGLSDPASAGLSDGMMIGS